jgi:transcriptional regulator with XRE-family HTH domain
MKDTSKTENLTPTENGGVTPAETGAVNPVFLQFFENALKQKGLTRYKIADMLEIDKAHIGRIAKGVRLPSVKLAKRIGALLEFDWHVFYPPNSAKVAMYRERPTYGRNDK